MSTDVAKSLKKLSKTWAKTEAKQASGFPKLEDGKYIVNLKEMKVGMSKKGRLQVATLFKVVKPKEAKGKEKMAFHGLENENNISYFKGFAEVLGLEVPDDIEDLPAAVESFVEDFEDTITIEVKTKGDFQNVSVIAVGDNKVSEDSESEDDDDSDNDEEKDEEDEDEEEEKDEEDEDEDGEDEDEDEGEEDDEDEDDDKKKKPRRKKSGKDKKKKKKSRR